MSKDSKKPEEDSSPTSGNDVSRREFMDRAAALGVSTAVLASMGAGILPGEAKAATPKRGGHLRVGLAHGNTSDSLDPAVKSNTMAVFAQANLMSQLVEVDKTGGLVPELAESWEPGDSPSTWIFNLRKDVTFHDGKSFDADDVVGTILYHSSEESKSAMKSTFKTIKELKADTKHRVVMTLDGPNAHFPFLMSSFEIRSIRDGKIYDIGNGTGSYVLKDFVPGQRLTMERNPNFWRKGLGHFDSAEIITILDTAARQNALISGEVDVINNPDRKTWKRLKAAKGVDVVKVNAKLHRTWPMQSDTPPFDNNDVRLALKYAVDREELVEKVLNGTGSVGNDHPISPINKYFNTELPQRVYDPDKAKFHLRKAGMETLTVKLSTSEAIWDGAMNAAVLYSERAAKAGIKLKVNKVPNDGYWGNVWRKHPWCAAYWSGRPTEDWMFTQAYSAGAPWNDTKWNHPRFNELLTAARSELDESKAREMYWEMQQIVRDEGSTVIPVYADFIIGHSTKLANAGVAGNWDLDGMRLIERWWFA